MIFNVLIFILGLIVGSFLAAFSYRLPKNISVANGRSFCPNCKKQIAWFDNIPLLSYIFLGGKCRNCKKHISFRYPLIELFTGLGFLAASLYLLPDYLSLAFYIVVFCLLMLIFVIDLEHQIIPDTLVFFGILFVFLFFLLTNHYFFPNIFAGFFAATILMLIHLATKGRGMGLGDVKFAIFGGMISGLNHLWIWLFTSFLTGGIVGIILILAKKAGLKSKVAFGPFLVVGLILTIIWGEKLMHLLLLN